MEKYPELVQNPTCAEQFFNEYKSVLPEQSLLAGFSFALNCDNFHWAFNKYLLSEEEITLYRASKYIRQFFSENEGQMHRLILFAIFIEDYLKITEKLLMDREYYELLARFTDAKSNVEKLTRSLIADHKDQNVTKN